MTKPAILLDRLVLLRATAGRPNGAAFGRGRRGATTMHRRHSPGRRCVLSARGAASIGPVATDVLPSGVCRKRVTAAAVAAGLRWGSNRTPAISGSSAASRGSQGVDSMVNMPSNRRAFDSRSGMTLTDRPVCAMSLGTP